MQDLLARVIAWSVAMSIITVIMIVVMSFVMLGFYHPFENEIGRAVWACFGFFFARHVIKHQFGDE